MLYYTITIAETGESFRCSAQETLLIGMERLGKKGIPVGCRGGGCGVCKVQVSSGTFQGRAMSRDYVSEADEVAGRVLACRVRPTSDITLSVLGKMQKSICALPAGVPFHSVA